MLKILLKKQLTEIFRGYFYDAKKNKARSRAATAAYLVFFVVLMVGVLGGMFALLSAALCSALASAGMDWLYFALMGLLAILLGTFGSVFNTYSGLYLAKDNDQLLSLPIPVSAIMAARLLSVYLMGFLYSAVVFVPALIVYWVTVPLSASVVAGGVLMMVLLSLVVLTMSCALGWVVARISLKLKHKSFITVVVSLLFLAAYYFFYFKAQGVISDLIANAVLYGERIRDGAYPLYLFGRVATGDGAAMAAVSAVVLVLWGLMWAALRHSFLHIVTSSGASAKRRYREKAARRHSVDAALLGKEFGRFTASPNYMLNCGLGALLLLLGAGTLLWKGDEFLSVLALVFAERDGCLPALLCAMLCMLAAMVDTAAPSVSLEGRNLWLVQSLPVTPWQVLRAKLRVQLLLSGVPAAVCLLCAAAIWTGTPGQLAAMAAVTVLFVLLSALTGLALGLKMPNLHWTNEVTPIKQSACVALALFGGWIYGAALFGGYLWLGWRIGFSLYAGCWAVVTAAACLMLYLWLKKRGCALFASL